MREPLGSFTDHLEPLNSLEKRESKKLSLRRLFYLVLSSAKIKLMLIKLDMKIFLKKLQGQETKMEEYLEGGVYLKKKKPTERYNSPDVSEHVLEASMKAEEDLFRSV
jgi:hypothetical protein